MGLGDNLMATGMARGAAKRGKRIAFGDGYRIRWDQHSGLIFHGNGNIAPPGHEGARDLEWIAFYKGSRIYNKSDGRRWIWNYEFRPIPGELFLRREEIRPYLNNRKGFVLIEPNVPAFKSIAPNKQWPVNRYEDVALALRKAGIDVVQMVHRGGANRLHNARHVETPTFRCALAMMQRAGLYVGPEGGLHHAAAAFNVPAVVLFGGFIPPQVTGYETHTNLTGDAEACGSLSRCDHCIAAMNRIGADEVLDASLKHLERRAA